MLKYFSFPFIDGIEQYARYFILGGTEGFDGIETEDF